MFKKQFNCLHYPRGVLIDRLGNLHVATILGLERFCSIARERLFKWGLCGDIAISREVLKFVTYIYEGTAGYCVYDPDDSLLQTIGGLHSPLGVLLDQSGYVFVADYVKKRVVKY